MQPHPIKMLYTARKVFEACEGYASSNQTFMHSSSTSHHVRKIRQARNAFQKFSHKNSTIISFYAKIFTDSDLMKACISMSHNIRYTKRVTQNVIELQYVI